MPAANGVRACVNSGNDTCVNNNQTTWTYNQGVFLNGLTSLAAATGNASIAAVAAGVLKAVEVGAHVCVVFHGQHQYCARVEQLGNSE